MRDVASQRTKRAIRAGLSVSAAAALLIGLATTAVTRADDKPTLAFVVNGASDFWKAAEAGVKKAQGELPDYNLELKYPEQSSSSA